MGASGRTFPEGDSRALTAILEQLADNQELRNSLALQGKTHAIQRYAAERLAADILDVWRSLTAAERRSYA